MIQYSNNIKIRIGMFSVTFMKFCVEYAMWMDAEVCWHITFVFEVNNDHITNLSSDSRAHVT